MALFISFFLACVSAVATTEYIWISHLRTNDRNVTVYGHISPECIPIVHQKGGYHRIRRDTTSAIIRASERLYSFVDRNDLPYCSSVPRYESLTTHVVITDQMNRKDHIGFCADTFSNHHPSKGFLLCAPTVHCGYLSDLRHTVAHEYIHGLSRLYFRFQYVFSEGIAEYFSVGNIHQHARKLISSLRCGQRFSRNTTNPYTFGFLFLYYLEHNASPYKKDFYNNIVSCSDTVQYEKVEDLITIICDDIDKWIRDRYTDRVKNC